MDNVKPDKKGGAWLSYVDYVNSIIVEGIVTAVCSSMDFLSEQISIKVNQKEKCLPMFDVKIDLVNNELAFDPPIVSAHGDEYGPRSIQDIIFGIVTDFVKTASQFQRLDTNQGDYLCEVKDHYRVYGSYARVSKNMAEMQRETENFIDQYSEFSFLWKEKLDESFAAFIDSGEVNAPRKQKENPDDDDDEDEVDEKYTWMAAKILKGVPQKRPSLDKYEEKLTYLAFVKSKIAALKTPIDRGWLKIISLPLIQALQNIVSSWIDRYTAFLLDSMLTEIANIKNFISEVSEGIKVVPE